MKKFTWIFGLALLWGGLNAVAQTVKEIRTFADLQEAGTAFANARTVNSRLAAKNKELETANKAVQTAEKNLSDAENKLTEWTNKKTQAEALVNDLIKVQGPAAKRKWESENAKISALEDAYNAQNTLLENYKKKLAEYKEALDEATQNGTETTIKCCVNEAKKVYDFCNVGGEENPLWFKFDGENLTLILSVKERTGFERVLASEISDKWSSEKIAEKTDGDGIVVVELYYEVPGTGEKKYPFDIAETTKPSTLKTRIKSVVSDTKFKGVDETVKEINQNAIGAAQDLYDEQNAKVTEQTVKVQNAKDALDEQKEVVKKAKEEYNKYEKEDENGELVDGELVIAAKAEITTAQTNITAATTEKEEAQTALDNANAKVTSIEKEIEKINEDADKINNYKHLSIIKSIDVTDANFTLGEWGSDCQIEGNGCVITYPEGANGRLVGINRGTIEWLGVINGKLASSNSGGSRTTAFEATMNTETGKLSYNLYSAEGVQTPNLSMDGALAYRARPYFGVTITENKETGAAIYGELEKKTANNTVYKAEWTDAETKETTTFYTNATAADLSYNPAKGKDNTFAYVLDTDLNTTNRLTEATNVVVSVIQDGSTKLICKKAEFTDKVAKGSYIYIPTKFTAENLSYDRSFNASSDLATVCLPFRVSKETLETAGVTQVMQFDYVDAATNTYWFRYQNDGTLKANEPYVLKCNGENFKGGEIFGNLSNIEVAATGNIDRYAVAPSNPGKDAEFRGVFVSTNATELANGGNLYGFADGKFRPLVISEKTKFSPFRTYVRAGKESNVPAVTFNIGELDEDGNIVSDGGETGVNTAVKEADAFSVKGINGALVITSDKAQNVNIYTIGGSLVKATNVEVGTVTVPVAAGVYVVNGKKVFVK